MVKSLYVPQRGDLVWLQFDPQAGHEQAGRRPAFVISPAIYNRKTGLMLACPVTTKVKGYPFEVIIPPGMAVAGAILADQLKSLDWKARQVAFAAHGTPELLAAVVARVLALVESEAS